MYGYEGLGCIYWHMVAKLLLAVQEQVFAAADSAAPELPALTEHYRRVRDGLGYRKSAAAYGAFPADPYSHTAAEGGAQQPGMTGQVKEEILTRWGELGLRMKQGRVCFDPVLLDPMEVPIPVSYTHLDVYKRQGKHFNAKGEAIRLQCTLCHALPEVVRENAKGSVPSLLPEKAGEAQPESHQRPNFMHTHADDVAPECEQCHGAPLKRCLLYTSRCV